MGYIYLITNMETKKQYVGQTICNGRHKKAGGFIWKFISD